MRNWLKQYFIPHAGNNHRPYFFSEHAFVWLFGIIMGCEILFLLYVTTVVPDTRFLGEILPNVLVELTNRDRVHAAAMPLAINEKLVEAARLKANDMAQNGYFAHTSPAGITPWHWLSLAGYNYATAGENLAVNFINSTDVQDAWMKSPSHRANIINSEFTEIGVATAVGTYEGREAVFVVQFFGNPVVVAPQKRLDSSTVPDISKNVQVNTENQQNQPPGVSGVSDVAGAIKNSVTQNMPVTSASIQFGPYDIVANPATVVQVCLITIATVILGAFGMAILIKIEKEKMEIFARTGALLMIIALVLTCNSMFPIVKTAILTTSAYTQTASQF
ncbi:MAG: hypothetical protein RIQ54_213 [Candidatus Parcubacteria bacterium]|jgi:hypothetical protein